MKEEVRQLIHNFCDAHHEGSAFIYINAGYVARALNTKKEDVIGSIPPIFDPSVEDGNVIFWDQFSEEQVDSLQRYFVRARKKETAIKIKKRLLKTIAKHFPDLRPEVRVPPAWVTKALALKSNSFDPEMLRDDLREGEITQEGYNELLAKSTQFAWRNSDEKMYRDSELEEADILLHERKITPAEYNRREKKFYISLKKRGIPLFFSEGNNKKQVAKVQARQRTRAKKPAGDGTRSSVKSGDGNSSAEPEPPRQLLYTFKSFAQLVDCSEKTLRNKVSAGLFPQPQKTSFGPRFTKQHLDFAVTPPKPATARTRGRPRIADSLQGGVQ